MDVRARHRSRSLGTDGGLRPLVALGTVALCACLFLAATAELHADDDDAKRAKPAGRTDAPHLDYQRTYAAALAEARIRNVPVFVGRHKDF